jgi:GTP-binding protein
VIETAKEIYDERSRKIPTSKLNEVLQEELKSIPPPSYRGREVRINYITQVKSSPPVFAFFTNFPEGIPDNYKRFLEKKVRENFGFKGVPIQLVFKKKN